ncbi:UNVERIFIED_CONTAM: hypothetical protein K2H54_001525 [Gekko kuhli]
MASAVPGSSSAGQPLLASARAWVPRPFPVPLPGRAGRRLLRLQLSAAPGQDRFRLGLRGGPDSGPEPSLVEYSLREISYEVKTPTCHELKVLARPDDPIVFHFEDEHEAQKWWAVVSSSLWEVQKAAEGPHMVPGRTPPHLSAATNSLPVSEPEASLPSDLARKEDLASQLSTAIELGDQEEAVRCATALAQQQAALRILPKESCYPASEISMKVGVEDAMCSATITIPVQTGTTIAALRQKVFQDYGFHPSVQRWIIGQCLCVDDRTVGSYGIRKDGDTAFLYLLTAKVANLSEQRYKEDKDWVLLQPAPSSLSDGSGTRRPSSSPLPKKGVAPGSKKTEIEERLSALQLTSLLPSHPRTLPAANVTPPSPVQDGWSCPTCTFINKPTRPGCEMCSTGRPASYVVPGSYRPDEMELWRMQQEKEGILKYQQEKGRREDSPALPCAQGPASLEDFIHLSSEFS